MPRIFIFFITIKNIIYKINIYGINITINKTEYFMVMQYQKLGMTVQKFALAYYGNRKIQL